MNAVFKFFDRLTEMIPHGTMQMVRLGAVLVWLILGTIAIFYAWRAGSDSVPPSGQDLSQASIREKVERERNRQNPPGLDLKTRETVVIPDTGEFRREGEPDLPYRPDRKVETRPLPNGSQPKEPFSGERPAGPPYVGEDPSAYPNRGYAPARDPGASGTRDSRRGENESRNAPLLPAPGQGSDSSRGRSVPPSEEGGRRANPSAGSEETGPSPRRVRKARSAPAGTGRKEPSLYPRRRAGAPGLLPPSSGRPGGE